MGNAAISWNPHNTPMNLWILTIFKYWNCFHCLDSFRRTWTHIIYVIPQNKTIYFYLVFQSLTFYHMHFPFHTINCGKCSSKIGKCKNTQILQLNISELNELNIGNTFRLTVLFYVFDTALIKTCLILYINIQTHTELQGPFDEI